MFDYTAIVVRVRTANWSNDSHQTGVVKPVKENLPINCKTCVIERRI